MAKAAHAVLKAVVHELIAGSVHLRAKVPGVAVVPVTKDRKAKR